MRKEERYRRLIAYFEQAMPKAESELHYENPFQLLVAVMLSAQCTDKRVNMVTPALFKAYPDAKTMAAASVDEILAYVKSVSYPNSKSAHLKGMAEKLVSDFGGMAVAFDQPAMPVDTHVFRVSERIGLTTNSKTPLQTELTLEQNFPPEKIPVAHHWLILHGRYVCTARKPHCQQCGISDICRYYARKKREQER